MMSETETVTFSGIFGQFEQRNPWRIVGLIAERLGVQPIDGRSVSGAMIVSGAEYMSPLGGTKPPHYDMHEVVLALLDRLDDIERKL